MYIYKTTNTLNGKIYIGLSSKLVEESTRYLGSGRLIKQAINKYGKEHFTKEILETDIEDFDLLCEREIYWIKELESRVEHGNYNITDGGEGTLGFNLGEEARKRMSEAKKELWKDPKYRAKVSEAIEETWKDPEYMAKMSKSRSKSQKENWKDPEYREMQSEARKDPEYRAKVSEVHKENWKDPEYKAKMSEVFKETWKDPEYRAKMSEAHKENWKDPEYKSKMVEVHKEAWKDPERKAKMSAKQKGKRWWNNPETGKCAFTKENMPSQWILGRGKKKH